MARKTPIQTILNRHPTVLSSLMLKMYILYIYVPSFAVFPHSTFVKSNLSTFHLTATLKFFTMKDKQKNNAFLF